MKNTDNIFKIIFSTSLLFILWNISSLQASSPSSQPVPITNLSLMVESTNSNSRQGTLRLVQTAKESKTATITEQKSSEYKGKIWVLDGVRYDIPVRENKTIRRVVARLTTKKREQMIKGLRRSGKYIPMIIEMLRKEGMPEDLVFMVPAESNFNVRSRSHKSAVGMWQFIAPTARRYGLKVNRWIDERRDPVLATRAAISYLKDLYGMFGDWELAMASYNAGEGRVRRAVKRAKKNGKKSDFWSLRLPRETRGYVPTILAMAIIYKNRDQYGFEHVRPAGRLDETQVDLPVAFSLEEVARRGKMSFKNLRDQNPALFLGVPPMTQERYTLYVPHQHHQSLITSLKQIPAPSKNWSRSYDRLLGNSSYVTSALEKYGAPIYFKVRKNDNLWDLARKHKTTVQRLARWNKLNSKTVLRVKQRMKIYVPTWRVFKEVARSTPSSSTKYIPNRIRVPKGSTLSSIARRYRTNVRKLMIWNKLSSANAIRAGQRLVVGYKTNPINNLNNLARNARIIRVPKNTTLSHLALLYKTNIKNLMKWNGLNHPKQLRTGMRLVVKAPSPTKAVSNVTVARTSAAKQRVRHRIIRVRSGDTLWNIAQQYQTSVGKLVSLNELKSAHLLRPNQKLIVPMLATNES